jgi:hypothetical protein
MSKTRRKEQVKPIKLTVCSQSTNQTKLTFSKGLKFVALLVLGRQNDGIKASRPRPKTPPKAANGQQ